MRKRTIAAVVLSATLTLVAPLRAQDAGDAQRVSLSVGGGPGWVRVSCDICQTTRELGPSAFMRLSTPVRPNLRVAGEATAWTNSASFAV